MAINFVRLYTKIGKLVGGLNETNTYRTTLAARADTLFSQYTAAQPATVTGVFAARDSAQQSESGYLSYLATVVADTIVQEVNADRPLTSLTLGYALPELVRQMALAGTTLDADAPTISPANVGSPVGDYTVVTTALDGTGFASDLVIPDVYLVTVTADQSTGATRWADTLSVVGKTVDASPLDYTYPTGSGVNTTQQVVDPAAASGLVTDPSFDSWGGVGNNTPGVWSVNAGTAGTNVFRVADDPRLAADGFAARLVSTGSLVKMRVAVAVDPASVYAAHFRVKKVADPGTDWGVTVRLTDATGTALAGPNSIVNSVASVTAASVAASWANVYAGVFVTPATIPAGGVFLEIVFHQFGSVATAPVTGSECYVDWVNLVEPSPLYAGGPSVTYFSGLVDAVVGDTRTVTATVAVAPNASLIRGIDKFIGLTSYLPLRIPTAASGTYDDSLIS